MKNKILYRRQALILLQKNIRGHLVKKKYAPRIKTIKKIRALDVNLKNLEGIAKQLKKDRDISTNGINQLKSELAAAIDKIKVF